MLLDLRGGCGNLEFVPGETLDVLGFEAGGLMSLQGRISKTGFVTRLMWRGWGPGLVPGGGKTIGPGGRSGLELAGRS